MTKYCNGCNGVIGRDCYNPRECEQIANNMNNYQHDQLQEDYRIARETIQKVAKIANDTPELNMCNYDEEQVEQLNQAMIDIFALVKDY